MINESSAVPIFGQHWFKQCKSSGQINSSTPFYREVARRPESEQHYDGNHRNKYFFPSTLRPVSERKQNKKYLFVRLCTHAYCDHVYFSFVKLRRQCINLNGWIPSVSLLKRSLVSCSVCSSSVQEIPHRLSWARSFLRDPSVCSRANTHNNKAFIQMYIQR